MAVTSIHPIRTTEVKCLKYVMNENKSSLISCFSCNGTPTEISHDFKRLRELGIGKGSILSYHLIQSFAPSEVTAEQVHQAGLLLCDKLLQGKFKYVLCTHTDMEHLHNHIIFCKTDMESLKSFSTLFDKEQPAWKMIRKLSDEVCKEMGLSVVQFAEMGKGVSHYEWEKQKQGTSWKAKLRYELDCIIQRSDTFEDFLEKCKLNGIETVYNPDKVISLKFRMQGQQRYTRAKTLGFYYFPENIKKRIENFSHQRKTIIDREKFNNKGFQHWADIQNMKNVAQIINILESYNIHSTSELKPTTMSVMARRGMITQSIGNLDKKIDDLSKHIELVRDFQRAKPYHEKYKNLSNFRKKLYVKNNAEMLETYRNAGIQLKVLYPDGKFPSETALDEQRQALYDERSKLYDEYRRLKKEYADLDRAGRTIEQYLASQRMNRNTTERKANLNSRTGEIL